MRHPDEGTIHAWLDGALADGEAAALAAHVEACPACAERVREARGLMAGASRIVTATDWGVGAARSGEPPRGIVRQPVTRPRRLLFTPWRGAAAVVLLVAAGTLLVTWEAERGRGTVAEPERTAKLVAQPDSAAPPIAPGPPARRIAAAKMPTTRASAEDRTAPAPAPSSSTASSEIAPAAAAPQRPEPTPAATADAATADAGTVRAEPARSGVLSTRAAARAGAPAMMGAASAFTTAVRSGIGCYEAIGDSAPAFVPRRFVLAPDGGVRVDGTPLPGATWSESPAGELLVTLATMPDRRLRLVDIDGTLTGLAGDGGVVRAVRMRRCD